MTKIDIATLSHEDFERARGFMWRPLDGSPRRLDQIDAAHLANLRNFLRRRLEQLHQAEEDFQMSKIDPQTDPGFSGLEEPIIQIEDALKEVLIESHRRALEDAGRDEAMGTSI